MYKSLIPVVIIAVTSVCNAQSRQIPAPKQTSPIAISGAIVHTMNGETIEDGFVMVVDGRISQIGKGTPRIAGDITFVDGAGLHLYPGLISIGTNLGLIETGQTQVTHDYDELGNMTPEVRAVVAVNPDTDYLPVTREAGILTAIIFPTGGRVPGRASAIRMDGWTNEDLTILDDAGLVINWPRFVRNPSRGGPFDASEKEEDTSIDELDDVLDRARNWKAARDAGVVDHDVAMAAMQGVLDGLKPVFIIANTKQQILSGVAWAKRHAVRPIIVGGAQGVQCAELLIKENVPVVCNNIMDMPKRRDLPFDSQYTLPSRLRNAGISFCLASGESAAHERSLPFVVGKATAHGLTDEQGVAAITKDAANICGLGDTLGTIETGKAGTLILTDGSPLDIRTKVHRAWIDGREISLKNRHSELNDKYREKYEQQGR